MGFNKWEQTTTTDYGTAQEAEATVTDRAQQRKNTPVYSGVLAYFPNALLEVSKASYIGQQQHNPDKPLAWDREKSGDELDAMIRHLLDHARGEIYDTDGIPHMSKVSWRALAYLEKMVESETI